MYAMMSSVLARSGVARPGCNRCIAWDALCACSFLACCAIMLKHLEVSADVRRAACGRYALQQLDAANMSQPDSGPVLQQNKFRSKAGYRCLFSA